MQEHSLPQPDDEASTDGLTAIEAAARLGLNERTIRRAIADGTLEATRRGNAFSISLEALEQFGRQRAPGGRNSRGRTPPLPPRSRQSDTEAPILAFVPPEEPARAPIPRPLDALIGREGEIAAIKHLLRQPDVRLVTLLGPGGVGKTRVAIAVAEAVQDHFGQGVVFIPLAPVTDPDRVLPTIAHALNLRDSGDRPLHEAVVAALAHRELLLVLDNLEQVTAAADDLAEILARCPAVRMLVTSREPLRIAGESRVPVAPLALPPADTAFRADVVTGYPAIALCLDRARRVRPDLELSPANIAAINAICHRLDGLPLAIEMATAWLGTLSPPALLTQMERRLPLLTNAYRNAPDRQRTMHDAVAWSYDLLSPGEQIVFRALAVCVGGLTLDAAQALSAGALRTPEGTGPQIQALAFISALVEKNLLIRIPSPGGEDRFGMYETVREYGLDQLDQHGELPAARRAHAAWYRALAEIAGPRVMDTDQVIWLDRLEADHDNLRAALTFALAQNDHETALVMGAALWEFWYIRGHVTEGLQWLDQALALAPDSSSTPLVQTLIGAGQLAHYLGESDRARSYLTRALTLARALGDPIDIGLTLLELGIIAEDEGNFAEATRILEEARDLYATLPVSTSQSMTSYHLAVVAYGRGDLAEAASLCAEALQMAHAANSAFGIGAVQAHFGLVAGDMGQTRAALDALHEALALYVASQDLEGIARCLANVAVLATTTRQWRAAASFWGAVATMNETLGYGFREPEAPRYAAAERETRHAVGAAFARLHGQGRAWGLAETVEHARTFALPGKADHIAGGNDLGLTAREREVLSLIAAGYSDREIADRLFISRHTATTHVGNILLKLDVSTRAAAAARAVQAGLIALPAEDTAG
jgi:non-specific serine/threonine protein kinase